MNKIVSWLKSIRLGKVITVFLSAIILFVSTACGGNNVLAKTADQVREEVPSGAVTSPYKGGMNDYSDVDPRTDTSRTQAKTKALIDNAERNVIDQTSDVGENTKRILDKKGENAQEYGQNAKRDAKSAVDKAQNKAEEFSEGTKRGTENLKGNTQNALSGAKQAADDAPDAVKSKVRSDIKNTKQTLEGASDIGKKIGDKASDAID